ncbi:MAG: LPS export ABC transporter ATP-binding protein [Desulfococcaceae bacterium]|jgi:lipopolysaccharide export system ATP-binding protein|nr:LPS export ABC transporter ATP-binding protein [Desulfococcaceae bacterium]
MAVFSLRGLVKIYRGRAAVDAVNLRVESGTVVGLLGPNGAGKTTTFYMAVGLIRPDSGQVFIDTEDITALPMYCRARKGIGYLPQENSVFRKLTVLENILAVLEFFPMTEAERKNQSRMLLEELGILHLSDRRAAVLSGGERRRLEISRALAADPAFMLLDEPFAGVDPLAVADIKNIIGHLRAKGIGILISDHNVRETLRACDYAYIMNAGQVIESGRPEKIVASKTARRIYLGEEFSL